jgi:hypothetical protein
MRHLRSLTAIVVAAACGGVLAKLPPLNDEAKAKAAEAAAKAAWTDKVGLYKLCLSMDRVADGYRKGAKAAGKDAPAPTPSPACADPGAYVSPVTPAASKPLEASGAHSPAGMAVSPPSNKATSAELTGGPKK